jgi:hypothetical protein
MHTTFHYLTCTTPSCHSTRWPSRKGTPGRHTWQSHSGNRAVFMRLTPCANRCHVSPLRPPPLPSHLVALCVATTRRQSTYHHRWTPTRLSWRESQALVSRDRRVQTVRINRLIPTRSNEYRKPYIALHVVLHIYLIEKAPNVVSPQGMSSPNCSANVGIGRMH